MAYTTIDDPSAFFQTTLYTGTGSDQNIVNGGNSDLKPDWVWVKDRGATNDHKLTDSNRLGSGGGPTRTLESNTTVVEYDDNDSGTEATKTFNTDGFTIGPNGNYNTNNNTYVAWQWKANGGTTASNSSGNITSTVQANTTAGFSIVTYTGNGTDTHTVGHGLSGNWDLVILKNRGQTDYWTVSQTGTNQVLLLHDPSAQANHSTAYLTKASGVIGLVNAGDLGMVNGSSENYVAYVFKEIKGYSKFGNYTGNGGTNGAFIYTGFSPAWVLTKRTSGSEAWMLSDNKRPGYNQINKILEPNDSAAEGASTTLDHLSNGFKFRHENSNVDGESYFYMAFAESPFVSSKGIPTTAR